MLYKRHTSYKYTPTKTINSILCLIRMFTHGIRYIFLSKVNIWNVNCARQQHSLSTHEQVFLWQCQRFWDRECLDLRGTRTPNLRIHAECFIYVIHFKQSTCHFVQHDVYSNMQWSNNWYKIYDKTKPSNAGCIDSTLLSLARLCCYEYAMLAWMTYMARLADLCVDLLVHKADNTIAMRSRIVFWCPAHCSSVL